MVRQLVRSRFAATPNAPTSSDGGDKEPPPLDAGHMRLFSYYKPSLEAGLYSVTTEQIVTAPVAQKQPIRNLSSSTSTVTQAQQFRVVAPQFTLDPKLIDSHYPPDGHVDEAKILPHIVFKDPHIPWLRIAGTQDWMKEPIDVGSSCQAPFTADSRRGQNFVPWLALMVFRPEELLVTDSEATALGLKDIAAAKYDPQKPPASGAYSMKVSDYLKIDAINRVRYEGDDDIADLRIYEQDTTSIIFPAKLQVANVMGGYKNMANRLAGMKLAAHVRQINTMGFPDAGVEEVGLFSIIMSTMSGDVNEKSPSTHVVHLVSIEHLDVTFGQPVWQNDAPAGRVGLVSLFSWSYTCIPDAVSFKDLMAAVAKSSQPLRAPEDVLMKVNQTALKIRLSAGYTVSRWRASTGEESIALNRGPLTPVKTRDVPGDPPATDAQGKPLYDTVRWPAFSMTGKDYTLFDESMGMLDVSYSSAWSMGRLMAISDSAFNAALMRLRNAVGNSGASDVRLAQNGISGAADVLASLQEQTKSAAALASGVVTGTPLRLNKPGTQPLAKPIDHPDNARPRFEAVSARLLQAASAGDALHDGITDQKINNADFEVVANWIYDAMYLGHMPAHVLFPDPTHLVSINARPELVKPGQTKFIPEALRFFYIDHAWIDCFIDGALSCANHHEPESDWTRIGIKRTINQALKTTVGSTGLLPPIPRYGFILRSAAVKVVPDIRLTVHRRKLAADSKTWVADDSTNPLVRHTRLDDYTILSLIDCSPEEIAVIRMSQPPHQQRFALQLDSDSNSDMQLRHMYTDYKTAPPNIAPPPGVTEDDDTKAEWGASAFDPKLQVKFYDHTTRCIDPLVMAQTLNDAVRGLTPKIYDGITPTSVVLALQLNDPSYQLQVNEMSEDKDWKPETWTRQLWDGGDSFMPPSHEPNIAPHPKKSATKILPIKLPKHGRDAPTPDAKSYMNSTAISPIGVTIPASIPYQGTTGQWSWIGNSRWYREPPLSPSSPYFELLVHPAYRSPPPRPQRASPQSPTTAWYAPQDNIPLKTNSRYDLIFAIRRRRVAPWPDSYQANPRLVTIWIEIPVAEDNGGGPTGDHNQDSDVQIGREPLLSGADFSSMGVRMCNNPHFVPALFTGAASSSGNNPTWDGKKVLAIAINPRTSSSIFSSADGQQRSFIEVAQDQRTRALGVRLTEPALAWTRKPTRINLVQGPGNQRLPNPDSAGVCMIKMTEVYVNTDGKTTSSRWSWYTANKVDRGDKDPQGNAI